MSEREVERGSGVAVWRQIGEALADDIRNKLYGAGRATAARAGTGHALLP